MIIGRSGEEHALWVVFVSCASLDKIGVHICRGVWNDALVAIATGIARSFSRSVMGTFADEARCQAMALPTQLRRCEPGMKHSIAGSSTYLNGTTKNSGTLESWAEECEARDGE